MKKLTITGNVGRDAEIRYDSNGQSFVVFSVAVTSGTKENPKTDWIDISCNGRLVEVAQTYIRKGIRVLVDGYPSVGAYINQNNIAVGTLRLYAHTLELLSKPIYDDKSAENNRVESDGLDRISTVVLAN